MTFEKEPIRKHKELEALGYYVDKEVYMEIEGETPLIPERRAIALKGKIINVQEFNVDQKTITIEIPLSHITTLSEHPIQSREDSEEQQEP